jgi:hypothetical protein
VNIILFVVGVPKYFNFIRVSKDKFLKNCKRQISPVPKHEDYDYFCQMRRMGIIKLMLSATTDLHAYSKFTELSVQDFNVKIH